MFFFGFSGSSPREEESAEVCGGRRKGGHSTDAVNVLGGGAVIMGCFCAAHFAVFVTEELQRSEKVLLRFQHLTDSLIVFFFHLFSS